MTVLLALAGFVLCCFVVMRRKWMLLTGLGIFLFGCAIYAWPQLFECRTGGSGFLGSFSKSLSAFYPSRGGFERGFEPSSWYWLFHSLAIFYVTALLVALFGGELVHRLFLFFRRLLGRPVNVFWGYSEEAKTIAKGIDDGKGSVVFVMPESKRLWLGLNDEDDIHAVAKAGWRWITGKSSARRGLARARRHFFMGGDGHQNVADAEALIRSCDGRGRIMLYVRIAATADDDVLYKWADKWNMSKDKNVEVVIVREESLVSRRFLIDNPMWQCRGIEIDARNATVDGDFKVLLLGFGSQGKMLLNDMICDSQFLTSNGTPARFMAHVFDRDCAAFGAYEEICGEAVRRYNIAFDGLDVGSARFWRRFSDEMAKEPYNRVVVCLRDDRENIRIANDIARVFRELGLDPSNTVFARVRDSLVDAYIRSTFLGNESERRFTSFGAMSDTYSFANIVTRKWEKGAIWLNGDWGLPPGAQHDEAEDAARWKKASFFNKESSRASFLFQRNLLRLIGYRVDETSDDNNCFNDKEPMNHLDILAEDEHLRWMAYHFVRGVKVWSPTPQEIEEKVTRTGKAARHNAIADINAHADLVDYAALPGVDALFDPINERHGYRKDKDTQEKDKGFIRSEAMRRSGLGIRRI